MYSFGFSPHQELAGLVQNLETFDWMMSNQIKFCSTLKASYILFMKITESISSFLNLSTSQDQLSNKFVYKYAEFN